ncbi:hypothetical protein [Adhaeretor mobilis]|nr:hypothetical protein [Adhaeretor mobilis]
MAQTTETTNRIAEAEAATEDSSEPSQPFIGKWNNLVSTTNWDKGQIISEWRDALIAADAAASEYSDEAWAQLVGGVTSQHVGRLRRVYQQFGENVQQYPGLFWSHFQAAIDWDDAEMWLEGAIQNGWSISQMRGKRWETVGKPGEQQPEEPSAELEGSLEDGQQLRDEQADSTATESLTPKSKELQSPGSDASPKASAENRGSDGSEEDYDEAGEESSELEDAPKATKTKRERLPVDVDDLPDDLAEAFEQFKLAIISHRREGWNETRCETVVECLDALKMLAEAPLD